MSEHSIVLPSKPRVVSEDQFSGTYEIDGLYPGYGHTLGNSLRRIILSSLPGAAITAIKIDGVNHEFSVISGIKEDVITLMLNLKKIRIKMLTQETQVLRLKVTGEKEITAASNKIKIITSLNCLNTKTKGKFFFFSFSSFFPCWF